MANSNKLKKVILSFLSLIFRNKRYEQGISPDKVKKILVVRHDALGDMFVTLPAIASLRTLAPKAQVHVLASHRNYRLLENDPHVDKFHIVKQNNFKFFIQMLQLRKEKFDVIISSNYIGVTKQGVIANIIGNKDTFKSLLYTGEDRYTYYNFQSKKADIPESMWERMYIQFADTFALSTNVENITPYLYTSENDKLILKSLLGDMLLKSKEYIVINLSAGQPWNRLTEEEYVEIIRLSHRLFHKKIVLINIEQHPNISKKIDEKYTVIFPDSDVLTVAELIRNALVCITPDTGIVHMASAVRTPTLGIYNKEYQSRFWAPYKVQGGKVINDKDMILNFKKLASALASELGVENEQD